MEVMVSIGFHVRTEDKGIMHIVRAQRDYMHVVPCFVSCTKRMFTHAFPFCALAFSALATRFSYSVRS
jgi:hypothetical protein